MIGNQLNYLGMMGIIDLGKKKKPIESSTHKCDSIHGRSRRTHPIYRRYDVTATLRRGPRKPEYFLETQF